ncbi:MAG: hypothetical protein ACYCR4_05620 [Acidimicrobiales bacterium]
MTQTRRPAGVPTGGQFAPTNRPGAGDLGLSDEGRPVGSPVADGAQGESSDEDAVETCDECGAEGIEGELVNDRHADWCSLHSDNTVDAGGTGLPRRDDPRVESSGGLEDYQRFVGPRPSSSVERLARPASLTEAIEAEGQSWSWTSLTAVVGKERAEDLFERSGGSLGTALALEATKPTTRASPSPASGKLPVSLQAHLLRTGNASANVAAVAADQLESQHRALRSIQALLSAPEWDSAADYLEEIAAVVERAGYPHAAYRPEVGEPIELEMADRAVVGRLEMVDGDETLVVPSGGGRAVRVTTGAIEWDRDGQTWFSAPDEDVEPT